MTRILKYAFFSFFLMFICSCSDDMNINLNGKWQLKEVQYEGKTELVDTVFFNFKNELFQYQIYKGEEVSSIGLYGFCTSSSEKEIKIDLRSTDFLKYTDWKTAVRSFEIKEKKSSSLVLYSEDKTYYLKKFF